MQPVSDEPQLRHERLILYKLLDSFLAMNNTDYILEIYGDGDYRAELVELAAKHDRIIYKGLVSRDVISQCQKCIHLTYNIFLQTRFYSRKKSNRQITRHICYKNRNPDIKKYFT